MTEQDSLELRHTGEYIHTEKSVCFNAVCFNTLSPYKPCENLLQNFVDKIMFYILCMTLQVKTEKLYSILNISRQYLKRVVRKCVEIKAQQVTNPNPSGMVINLANVNYSFSLLIFIFINLSV